MANKKKLHIKKYNPEIDVVPLSPSTFAVGSNAKEGNSIFIEFAYDNEEKDQRISLGSYVIPNKMAKGLVEMLQKSIVESEQKSENNE